jgi:putative endopeptidase
VKRFPVVLAVVFLAPLGLPAGAEQTDPSKGVLETLDPKADPCVDFYDYACGGWLASYKLPADEVSYTRSFSSIDDRNLDLLHGLLEDAAKDTASTDANWQKIGAFYGSCMDEEGIEARMTTPIAPYLKAIKKVKTNDALMTEVADLGMMMASPLFGDYVQGDFKDPKKDILFLGQGGLGLPDRDYYLRTDDEAVALRADYVTTIAQMLTMIDEKDPEAEAKGILAFETELAKIQKPQDELRDPKATYNKVDKAGLQALTPNLPWDAFLAASGIPAATDISVADPHYFEQLDALVAANGAKALQPYLKWHLLMATAAQLNEAFVNADFAFFGKVLSGQEENRPRWKRCVDLTNSSYPEIVGKYYVDRAFPGDSKKEALAMIQGIEASFQAGLGGLDWMDDATRTRAVEKMNMIHNKIGYPDKWRDYSAVSATRGQHLENVLAARKFEAKRQLAKVGGPVDPTEWGMPPAMVNAYYDPSFNEIAFPAGILQEPFYSLKQPAAMNWGAMGMVMGHELTHGFDDQGAQFDGNGAMVDWWAPDVVTRFNERTQCVKDQYSAYEVKPGLNVNGDLTVGENIADIGGIKESYNAYKAWEAANGTPAPAVAGMTNDQLFFVGYAQAWCSKRTPEIDQMYATVDPHSPPRWRVNGPLSDTPAFAAAFSCAPGTPMNPEKQCVVW